MKKIIESCSHSYRNKLDKSDTEHAMKILEFHIKKEKSENQ